MKRLLNLYFNIITSLKYCLFIFLFVFTQLIIGQKEKSYAQKGFVDLSINNLDERIVTLDGEWEFYWEQFVEPSGFDSLLPAYGELPVFWKNYESQLPRFGFATYRLRFALSESQLKNDLGLRLNNVHNSYKLWVNGLLLIENGKVGESKETSVPMWLPRHVSIPNLNLENEIVIQVSNYRHRNGGVQDPIEIGQYETFDISNRHQMASELFLGGGCFILGCFFIGMFFFWKKDRAALHFGIFTLFFGSRVILIGARSIVATFPDISWDFCIRLEYIGMFTMHYFMFHFIYYAFPNQTSKLYLSILKWVTAVLVLICFIPGDFFTFLTIPNNYYLVLTFGYLAIIFVKAIQAGVPGAIWAIMSMVIFFFTTIPVLLEYSNLFITDPVILSICYMGFMLSMSLVFASRFGKSFLYLEALSDVEKKKTFEISKQKESIEKRNQMINDSINYAERIQNSLLPSESKLRNYFNDCFLYFNPQGTVSGDFYWCHPTKSKDESYIAIADCTGHGVPGAFMSLIAINTLDNIVSLNPDSRVSDVLVELNEVIHNRLQKNDGDIAMVKDGLDIILCKVNLKTKTVKFASAHHKLIVIRKDGKEEVYNGDKHHIGNEIPDSFIFQEQEVVLHSGDQIYMLTDGIYDQKGGKKGKKLYLQRTKDLFHSVNDFELKEQKEAIENFLIDWKGDKEQLDDMLLFSIKF